MSSFFYIIKSLYVFLLLIIILLLKIKRKITRFPEDVFYFNRTFIESHRGLNREIFQNTFQSFKKAIDYNLESIEADVWLTKDNIAVLHHGYGEFGNIEGYFDHPGNITNLTYNELTKFRTIQDNLIIARLTDVMKLAKNKIFMNLEIKDPRIDIVFPHIIALIEEYEFFDQITLSSFNHKYYLKVQEYNKNNGQNIIFGFIYGKYAQYEFDYSKPGNTLNIYWADATKAVCENAHRNNMGVLVWFDMIDVETKEIYKQLIENGADIICCNDPLLAKKYLKYYNMKKIAKNGIKYILD